MNEAVGKILGMALAYGVSSLGLLLAYVNYRKRIVKAEKVMSSQAWVVMGASVLAIAVGAGVVASLAARTGTPDATQLASSEPETQLERRSVQRTATPGPVSATPRPRWPLIGIAVPGAIFLLATWITTALHRRFSVRRHLPGKKPARG